MHGTTMKIKEISLHNHKTGRAASPACYPTGTEPAFCQLCNTHDMEDRYKQEFFFFATTFIPATSFPMDTEGIFRRG